MSSDTLSSSSYLDRLPDELWLEVLGSLSYFDLKRTRSVCKRMDGWIKHPSLDKNLFRRGPSSTKLEGDTPLELHPVLHSFDGVMYEPGFATTMGNWDEDEINFFHCPLLLKEYATQPACTEMLCFMMMDEFSFRVKSSSGITVGQFLTEMNEYWTGTSAEDWTTDREANNALHRKYAQVEWLVDKNGWTGWDEAWVRGDGIVQLSCEYFDP
ncbi:hypothetical protein JCM8097_008984 [Rhodosporidiobolus ruineniae]